MRLSLLFCLAGLVSAGSNPALRRLSAAGKPHTRVQPSGMLISPPASRGAPHDAAQNRRAWTRVAARDTVAKNEDAPDKETRYGLWPALPLQPQGDRRVTKKYEIQPGKIWGFEQIFGTLDVLVNIRMTVIALKDGGLFVYSPVAPTQQCINMVRDLEKQYGEVKHIVLPTTAVEHKVFFGPFAKKFSNADLWVAPGQWSFPLDLPLTWLGLFPRRANVLPMDSKDCDAPWMSEFDYKVLKFSLGLAPFCECAFHHKDSKTLLVTDSVIFAPAEPPEVVQEDPRALLFRSKDNVKDPSPDTPEIRRKGWGKTVLFSQFLQPEKVRASLIEDYPALLAWDQGWEESWARVRDRLFVSPVVQVLVFAQAPETVSKWVEEVCKWPFTQVVPCHFKAPIKAGPREFRQAFEAARAGARSESQGLEPLKARKNEANNNPLDWFASLLEPAESKYKIGLPHLELEGDFALLRQTERALRESGVVKGPKGG